MKLSRNWLSEYVNIEGKDLFTTLSLHTSEVEEEISIGNLQHIVIGHVQTLEQHPDADKLRVATVDTGKYGIRQIVCGAKNLEQGQYVPVAIPGAIMPGDFEIKEATLRGVLSQGMICSEDELGLTAERQPGIMVLDNTLTPGDDFGSATGYADSILEIENKSITNRPDLFGHYGIARECSILWNTPLKPYLSSLMDLPEGLPNIQVTIENNNDCPRYLALRIDNVSNTPSPTWLKQKLQAIGQKSINAIVDVTNYVMQDLGQPMHAFDANSIGDSIEIGYSNHKEELLETLDSEERSISDNVLLIKSQGMPIAVAGIIGGAKSAITENTTSILLEVACFDPDLIRTGQKNLGLRTDASIRFEKSLDPEQCPLAMHKAILLLKRIFPEMTIASTLTDIYPAPKSATIIETSYDFLEYRIGKSISRDTMNNILSTLGMTIEETKTGIAVSVPSWRDTGDLSIPEDLVEEITRIFGYNALKGDLPKMPMRASSDHAVNEELTTMANILAKDCHLHEVHNYSFYSRALHEGLLLTEGRHHHPISVINPLSEEQEILRTSLVPQLARHASEVDLHTLPYGIFELERIYLRQGDHIVVNGTSQEPKKIAMVIASKKNHGDSQKSLWENHPFYHMKHLVSTFCAAYTSQVVTFTPLSQESKQTFPYLHPGKSADIYIGDTHLGSLGELHPLAYTYLKTKERTIVACEMDVSQVALTVIDRTLQPFSTLPEVGRDVTCTVDTSTTIGPMIDHIMSFDTTITSVLLMDIYQGKEMPKKKSASFHITFAHPTKTLTDQEVGAITDHLYSSLMSTFEGEIAGFSSNTPQG